MQHYIFPVAVFIFSIFILSCKDTEEEDRAEYQAILDSVIIDCKYEHYEYSEYIKGKINGKDFCYVNGYDGYKVGAISGFHVVTTTPYLILGDTNYSNYATFLSIGSFKNDIIKYDDQLNIQTPRWPGNHTVKEMVEHDLQVGEYLIRDNKISDTLSYLVMLNGYVPYEANPIFFSGVIMNYSNFGPQPGSYLKITKNEKSVFWGKEIYDIEGEFQCKLYTNPDGPMKGIFYGNLTEGGFKIQVVVDP